MDEGDKVRGLEVERQRRALDFFLFGGLSEEDFYEHHGSGRVQIQEGPITGYAEFDLETGELTCYDAD